MSDNHDLLNDNDMCSFPEHEAEDMCFNCGNHTCGDYCVDTKENLVEILYFRQFYEHFVSEEDEEGNRNKRIEKYFEVSAVVDVGIQKIVIFESSYIF